MALIGHANLDRPVAVEQGHLYYAYGGGPLLLAPYQCSVLTSRLDTLDFHLDIVRDVASVTSYATLSFTIGADYALDAALATARSISPTSSVISGALTDWWFRLIPSPVLRVPPELSEPILMSSDGLGTARFMSQLSIDSGLLLEAILQESTALLGMAEAQFFGVSPRLPVVVEFTAPALIAGVLHAADTSGALPREMILQYFAQPADSLPLDVSGEIDTSKSAAFRDAMTDRVIAQFGEYVPAIDPADAPVVRLRKPVADTSIRWALSQPFLAKRRLTLPIDLLSEVQAQVQQLGIDSVVDRRTLAAVPALGRTRVLVMANLHSAPQGVDALGVTLTFPPHPPARPQARVVTALFDSASAVVTVDVNLSPGEPVAYRYSAFAVVTDESGTRQIDAPERRWEGSPLRLSPEHFPIEFALVEVSPALQALAVISGLCSYDDEEGRTRTRVFIIDSGQTSIAIALPRERQSLRIDCVAIARDGGSELRLQPFESPQVRLDLSAFRSYGPQQIDIRVVFDDAASQRTVECQPLLSSGEENQAALLFTPASPVKTYRWFSSSPFVAGFRYRGANAGGGAWKDVNGVAGPLVLYSSKLERHEPARELAAKASLGIRETMAVRPGRNPESAVAAVSETTVLPVAESPAAEPTDELLYDRIGDRPEQLYVPRYVLDEQTVSGQQHYRMAFRQQDGASWLEVNLAATMAPVIIEANKDAEEYPHAIAIQLEYLVAPPAGAKKILDFNEVSRNANVVTALLRFATMAERDEVYRALTEPQRQCQLRVQRYIDVSVPYDPAPPPGGGLTLPYRPLGFSVLPKLVSVTLPPKKHAVTTIGAVTAMTIGARPLVLSTFAHEAMPRLDRTVALAKTVNVVNDPRLVRVPVDRFVSSLPTPTLVFNGTEEAGAQRKLQFAVSNWQEFTDGFFTASPKLPPGGLVKAAARTWVQFHDADSGSQLYSFTAIGSARQLAELTFTMSSTDTMPARVSVRFIDRRTKVQRTSNVVDLAVSQVTADTRPRRPVRHVLPQAVAPDQFVFPPALHGYIFQGLTPGSGGSTQLVRYRISGHGRFHTYLQDASRPSLVYFLADSFKLARRREEPYTPFATVRVKSRPDAAGADVVFDYVIAPFTDPNRLELARAELLGNPHFGAETIDFQPFVTSDVRYFVDRPSETGAVREERPGAGLVLQGFLKDTLAMTLGDFRLLFDAMHKRTASLFLGRVEVDVPEQDTEIIPFEARLDDLAGELFSYEAAADPDTGIDVILTNQIESPLSVQTLDATLLHGASQIPVLVQGPDVPRDSLLPGESIQVKVMPGSPMPAGIMPQLSFDLSGVSVLLDVEQAWNAILDRSTLDYFRTVTVKAIPTYFDTVGGREDEHIVSILIEFEGGGTAELSADSLEARVRVDHPIDDVILDRPVATAYRYTVTVIRASGRQDRDAEPRSGSAEVFFVSIVR